MVKKNKKQIYGCRIETVFTHCGASSKSFFGFCLTWRSGNYYWKHNLSLSFLLFFVIIGVRLIDQLLPSWSFFFSHTKNGTKNTKSLRWENWILSCGWSCFQSEIIKKKHLRKVIYQMISFYTSHSMSLKIKETFQATIQVQIEWWMLGYQFQMTRRLFFPTSTVEECEWNFNVHHPASDFFLWCKK